MTVDTNKVYDLRGHDTTLHTLWHDIEPHHGASWRTRKHSLSGFDTTGDKAHKFINGHRNEDVLIAVIFDFGVTVYLVDSAVYLPMVRLRPDTVIVQGLESD